MHSWKIGLPAVSENVLRCRYCRRYGMRHVWMYEAMHAYGYIPVSCRSLVIHSQDFTQSSGVGSSIPSDAFRTPDRRLWMHVSAQGNACLGVYTLELSKPWKPVECICVDVPLFSVGVCWPIYPLYRGWPCWQWHHLTPLGSNFWFELMSQLTHLCYLIPLWHIFTPTLFFWIKIVSVWQPHTTYRPLPPTF